MKLPFILAKRFVAGEVLADAIPRVQNLNSKGIRVSLDLLGENVTDRKTADDTLAEYILLLNTIKEKAIDSNISIKLTMMGLDIDRDYAKDNLYALLDVAQKNDQFVRIDMEGSAYTQVTIDLLKEAYAIYPGHVGVVIQAYLHRSAKDIDELAAMNADVRICKGAYNESPEIALKRMPDIREAYKRYAAVLLDKTSYPRIATHDDELVEWVKQHTAEKGIDKSRFEFQMLYGLRQATCETMIAEGYNVRVYVPYGTMWVPYFYRRLRERKENVWFVLGAMFKN